LDPILMSKASYSVTTETITVDPSLRRSWQEEGNRPHPGFYGFYEAVVTAHFMLCGYHVIRVYVATRSSDERPLRHRFTRLFHEVVGREVSDFLTSDLGKFAPAGARSRNELPSAWRPSGSG
jgi:hypothetical protein